MHTYMYIKYVGVHYMHIAHLSFYDMNLISLVSRISVFFMLTHSLSTQTSLEVEVFICPICIGVLYLGPGTLMIHSIESLIL